MNKNKIDEILNYWFGGIDDNALPPSQRTEIWFGAKKETDEEIRNKFGEDLKKALAGEYADWEQDPRGSLALIILLDQFSRHIYRDTAHAYQQDQKALDICLQGIQKENDHALSLLERAFFYFPLMHAENIDMQATSLRAFQILVNLSFSETRSVYENFAEYALGHYEVIKRFGRFPHRNIALGRPSTTEELEYLKTTPTGGF